MRLPRFPVLLAIVAIGCAGASHRVPLGLGVPVVAEETGPYLDGGDGAVTFELGWDMRVGHNHAGVALATTNLGDDGYEEHTERFATVTARVRRDVPLGRHAALFVSLGAGAGDGTGPYEKLEYLLEGQAGGGISLRAGKHVELDLFVRDRAFTGRGERYDVKLNLVEVGGALVLSLN